MMIGTGYGVDAPSPRGQRCHGRGMDGAGGGLQLHCAAGFQLAADVHLQHQLRRPSPSPFHHRRTTLTRPIGRPAHQRPPRRAVGVAPSDQQLQLRQRQEAEMRGQQQRLAVHRAGRSRHRGECVDRGRGVGVRQLLQGQHCKAAGVGAGATAAARCAAHRRERRELTADRGVSAELPQVLLRAAVGRARALSSRRRPQPPMAVRANDFGGSAGAGGRGGHLARGRWQMAQASSGSTPGWLASWTATSGASRKASSPAARARAALMWAHARRQPGARARTRPAAPPRPLLHEVVNSTCRHRGFCKTIFFHNCLNNGPQDLKKMV
jgi:hypothetical protein